MVIEWDGHRRGRLEQQQARGRVSVIAAMNRRREGMTANHAHRTVFVTRARKDRRVGAVLVGLAWVVLLASIAVAQALWRMAP